MTCPPPTADVSWQFAAVDPAVARLLTDGSWAALAETVKGNVRRTVYRVATGIASVPELYVKHDHPRSPRDRIKSLWRCKSGCEFRSGQQLLAAGVPTVSYLAWGRRGSESLVVTAGLQRAEPFFDAWHGCRHDASRRAAFLAAFGRFLGKLLSAGVDHPDLHGGNVLVRTTDKQFEFVLLDIYGARLRHGCTPGRLRRVFWLATGLAREITTGEAAELLAASGVSAAGVDAAARWRGLVRSFLRAAQTRWPGRRRRLLTSSSLCRAARTASGTWLLRPGLSASDAEAALAAHRENFRVGRSVVKEDTKRRLSRVRACDCSFIVKEFRRPRFWGRWRADCRCWLNSYRLVLAHVPAAQCFGWLRGSDGRGYLVFEDLGDQTLVTALQAHGETDVRRQLVHSAGELTAWLHQAGVAYGDLNPANFMMRPCAGPLRLRPVLVDPDRVRVFSRDVPAWRRERDLRQIIELLRVVASGSECLRLLSGYRATLGLDRSEFRGTVARLRGLWAG